MKKKITLLTILLVIMSLANVFSQEDDKKSSIENGYAGIAWGSDFETVKKNAKGKLQYLDENRIIITKDGEITYSYGFLYIDPEKTGVEAQPVEGENNAEKQARFFYTVVEFPYAKLEKIKELFVKKYGQPSKENIKRNRGAYIWESDQTIVIVWIDEYEKEPFVKRITYISKTIAGDLENYYYQIFNQEQIKVLKTLQP